MLGGDFNRKAFIKVILRCVVIPVILVLLLLAAYVFYAVFFAKSTRHDIWAETLLFRYFAFGLVYIGYLHGSGAAIRFYVDGVKRTFLMIAIMGALPIMFLIALSIPFLMMQDVFFGGAGLSSSASLGDDAVLFLPAIWLVHIFIIAFSWVIAPIIEGLQHAIYGWSIYEG